MEVLLAVYGSLKAGFHNHHYLKNAVFVGEFVTEPEYMMYSFHTFPAVTKGGTCGIHCEVYKISDQKTIDNINILEGFNGVAGDKRNFYDRMQIKTPFGEAFMYYVNRKIKGRLAVDDGNWQRFRNFEN